MTSIKSVGLFTVIRGVVIEIGVVVVPTLFFVFKLIVPAITWFSILRLVVDWSINVLFAPSFT